MTHLDFSHRPFIMGIVNVTPDSFSGDGLMRNEDFITAAVDQAKQMLADGADILDIGGESSRPGSAPIRVDEELHRILPVIEGIFKGLPPACGENVLISIDTVKAVVAEAALKAGADIINDISALSHDPAMAATVARHGCPVILMHNRSQIGQATHDQRLGGAYAAPSYVDFIRDVKADLIASVELARKAGIKDDKIILDPGLGFGKTVEQNLSLIKHLDSIKEPGFPVLMGPSRKSFIGKTLDLPVEERLEGTAAAVALCAFLDADIIRVHDVKFMARVAKMGAAIKGS